MGILENPTEMIDDFFLIVNASCLIVGDVMRIGDCPKRHFSERPEITTKSPEVGLVKIFHTDPMVPHFSPKTVGRQTFDDTITNAYCPSGQKVLFLDDNTNSTIHDFFFSRNPHFNDTLYHSCEANCERY